MADGEWLTPRQLQGLSFEGRQQYIHRRLEELVESDSEDEQDNNNCSLAEAEDDDEYNNVNVEDSDAEELQLPEYDPADETDSDEELEVDPVESSANNYTARDGTIWSDQPPQPRRFLSHNILRCSNTGPARRTEGLSIIHTFKMLMSAELCDIIIRETNRKATQCYALEHEDNPARPLRIWKPITTSEFDAYLGILLLAGVTHSNYVHTTDLWKTNSHPLYRASMGLQRFWAISRFIRFDNGNTRQQRKQSDKAAAISDIFLMLNRNLQDNYIAGASVTVDEQLYPYRGGTGFTQYIPSKPARYGIKVWWVCDATTSYPVKGQIYTGMAPSGERERNQGERVVKDLCCNLFRGSGRNIVCDNFFTSYNLASTLMLDYNLSILGTVNKRRTFIPAEFSNPRGRAVESSIFGFSNNISMCSYVPKKNKSVVLLSTSHYNIEIEGPKRKPIMILDYNKSKGGVDNMDKCLGEYSTKRRTKRWPLAFFITL